MEAVVDYSPPVPTLLFKMSMADLSPQHHFHAQILCPLTLLRSKNLLISMNMASDSLHSPLG